MPSADDPICFTKRRRDVRPLGIGESPDYPRRGSLHSKLIHLRTQHRTWGHDYCALDEIL